MPLAPCFSPLSALLLSFSSCCQCQISKLLKTSTSFPSACLTSDSRRLPFSVACTSSSGSLKHTDSVAVMEAAGEKWIVLVCLSVLYHWQQLPLVPKPPYYVSLPSSALCSSLLYLLPFSSLSLSSAFLSLMYSHTHPHTLLLLSFSLVF